MEIRIETREMDLALLRAQKLGLLALADEHPWLDGVVQLIDAWQDRIATEAGERPVFGPVSTEGDPVGEGFCRSCAAPIALDESGAAPVWIDVTGGDVCPGTSEPAMRACTTTSEGHGREEAGRGRRGRSGVATRRLSRNRPEWRRAGRARRGERRRR
ncbi:MAG: hypothetical protein ACP5PM_09895 [Acidimicrobiales bacterium]